MDNMEVGFRFHPTNLEIVYYLRSKTKDLTFSCVAMDELDIYNFEPWDLPRKAKFSRIGDEAWWFFNRPKKGKGKSGASRTTPNGYWKASGRSLEICDDSLPGTPVVALRRSLVFYLGRTGGKQPGNRTSWILHEYSLCHNADIPKENQGWAVCCIFQKDKDCDAVGVDLPQLPVTSQADIFDLNGDMATMPVVLKESFADAICLTMPLTPAVSNDAIVGESVADVCLTSEEEITLSQEMNSHGFLYSGSGNAAGDDVCLTGEHITLSQIVRSCGVSYSQVMNEVDQM